MELRDPRVQLTWASLRWAPRTLAQGLRRQALGAASLIERRTSAREPQRSFTLAPASR
jgi:hypothetical protein